jgi:hypothetical protein
LHSGHTRRLISSLSQVAIALVLVGSAAGCWDDGPYATTSPGTGGAGTGGRGGSAATGTAGSTGMAGASGSGPGGSVGGGPGGSIGPGGSVGTGTGGVTGVAGSGGPVLPEAWPSAETVVAVDSLNQFPKNLSDLVYQPAGAGDVLWGLLNSPSTLYCLLWNGTTWSAMTDDDWTNGKTLLYPGGTGSPDAEGLTRAEWTSSAIYVATERDNNNSMVSRLSVLRYDYAAAGTSLTATHEWNLTADLPAAGANLGLEGIAWVPDSFLVAKGFFDEWANALYDPSRYPNHGTGLFFVGLENDGVIFAFALDHSGGTYQRVATIGSGHASIMSLDFDRDQGNLWAHCDDACNNEDSVLRIGASGRFELTRLYTRPPSLANSNYEGITMAPESECNAQGFKSFFWSDDSDLGGHAIFRGSIPCGPLP